MLHTFIVVLGLMVFEVVSSIDNAIINAHVLKTMPGGAKAALAEK